MSMDNIIAFLQKNQWSGFYKSCLQQWTDRGTLSAKQIECIESAMLRQAERERTHANAPKTFTLQPGQKIEIRAWIARKLQVECNMSFFFRNLEVVEVVRETAKAYQLKIKFVSQVVTSCHVCGRDLDNDVSRACGIGPVCADKIGLARPTPATAQETLRAIDAMCQHIGTVGPVWIPKTQVKQ